MRLIADSDMKIFLDKDRTKPLVFMPDVEWNSLTDRTIIDAY